MPSLDTNILLRWLLDDVPEQTAAVDALIGGGERLGVPDVALIETVYVLERVVGLSRTTVALSVETVLSVANIDIDRAVWRECLDDYLVHPKVSITDAYLAAQARAKRSAPLWTFDRKLAQQIEGAQLLK